MGVRANTEVCIVGGGPAGLAAAIALRLAGFGVAVFDRAMPPVDKACGEGLMPESIAALRALGVEIPLGLGFPFRGVRFCDGRSSVIADFPGDHAIGVRRTVLHRLLIDRASAVGVDLHWEAKDARFTTAGLIVDSQTIKPKLLVGADGQNSAVRRAAGLHRLRRERRRFGFRRHYQIAPWSQYMELHWGKRCQLYVTPVSECSVGVALLSRDPKLRLDEALAEFPEIKRRLSGARACSREMGALTACRTLQRVCRPGLALVGDASGSVDAITGEGLSLAFRQGLALADAFRTGNLSRYQRAHRALMRRPCGTAFVMLAMSKRYGLQGRILAGLAKRPGIFSGLVALHVGQFFR